MLLIITTQIKSKAKHKIFWYTLAVEPGAWTKILLGLGKTTTEFQHYNIFDAPCF